MNRPWMPLYVGQYLADTTHLAAEEHGAYLLLIMHYWMNDGLPSDDRQLARIARMTPAQWKHARPVVKAFFQDGWKHKRIEFEFTEAARMSAAGKAGGRASAEARRQRALNDKPTIVERPPDDEASEAATIIQALPLPSQSKKENDDVVVQDSVPRGPYAFESGVIRLSQKHFDQWKTAFSHLDLPAELIGMTEWASKQPSWFNAVSGLLAKKNAAVHERIEQAKNRPAEPTLSQKHFERSGIEGVQ